MKAKTLKAANAWDATDEALRVLNVVGHATLWDSRLSVPENRGKRWSRVKSCACTRCGAVFHVVKVWSNNAPGVRDVYKLLAGPHALHLGEECAS